MSKSSATNSEWEIDEFDIPGYLSALDITPGPPSLGLLEQLHRAHMFTFPFSNVEVLLGDHPGVKPATVGTQLVERRRGGYCFEHSQLFAAALETLGFSVRRALGRVRALASPRTHMTVLVDVDGVRYLCDPGFGFSVTGPIPLVEGAVRDEGDREFSIGRIEDEGWPLWAFQRDGEMEHMLDESTVHAADVSMGHLKTSTDPESVFLKHLMVMKHTPEGHVTVTETGMTVRVPGKPTVQESLEPGQVVVNVRALGIALTDQEAEQLIQIVARLRG